MTVSSVGLVGFAMSAAKLGSAEPVTSSVGGQGAGQPGATRGSNQLREWIAEISRSTRAGPTAGATSFLASRSSRSLYELHNAAGLINTAQQQSR